MSRIAIVCSRFNEEIVKQLLENALPHLKGHHTEIAWVPGAFEIPLIAQQFAESGEIDAVICLGCVIRGETAHFDHVSNQAASGIMQVGLRTGIPVIFGVLTTENEAQAEARVCLGADYAKGALEMIEKVCVLRS
ncbi:MAG: 6,7-dimethyl-8-ribityllumazine synthase [Chlamydiales bacterium]|nr:6,7-dimethyl-8-ribityllumazine synthase [Chlamydiales bacterium]